MQNPNLIRKIVQNKDEVVPYLFAPIQFNILKKIIIGKRLNENEKRYLRGNMRKKLTALEHLETGIDFDSTIAVLLNSIGSYYITGLSALRYNGFGWYFEPKVIEVVNTKVEGRMHLEGKQVKLIRVNSISSAHYLVDKRTGLKYATNEQVLKDIIITKNEYAKAVWVQMLERYEKMFVKHPEKYKELIQKEVVISYEQYGV